VSQNNAHSSGLIPSLIAALGDADPSYALEAGRVTLHAHGVDTSWANDSAAWVSVEHAGQCLSLRPRSPYLTDDAREVIANLLRTAMRRHAEHERASRYHERMEMLSAASFEGFFFHVDGYVHDVNDIACELLGYTHDELLGYKMIQDCLAPEDEALVRERMANGVEGEYVITLVRRDGSRFRAEVRSKLGQLGDRPVRVAVFRDVTARERTHASLLENEARLRHILEAAFDVVVTSKAGVIVDTAGQLEKLYHLRRDNVIGRPILDFVAPCSQAVVASALQEQAGSTYEATTLVDGEVIPVSVLAVVSTLNGEPVRVAGLRDLRESRRQENERRSLEQRIERAQRLDSLGVLAGGIAHDFNNLLVGVLGGADLLLRRLRDPADRAVAEMIRGAGQRAAGLTKQMLAYAGRRDLRVRESVDMCTLCQELRESLELKLSKKARVELSLEPSCVACGEPAALKQVMMNLLTNASDALGDRPGTIRVSSRPVHVPDARWQHALGAPVNKGAWVLVEVADTGPGMDEATQRRIFEPFFSTKPRAHGLGLSSCLGIVTAHHGAILVESEMGRGCTFSVLLPASERSGCAPEDRVAVHARPCHILIADDEELVRTSLRRMLEQSGYTVEEAPDGESALSVLAEREPDVLVLDVAMPGLDGVDVVKRLRARGSTLPIVLCSGTLEFAADRGLPPAMVQSMLAKPFSTDELIIAIERARES
jgi:two-component system cell cycle sensor histidine kinase/response regulator CckA